MANESDYKGLNKDPMRLCPECRMEISVMANRCRYCGTIVGRPRKETERLTVEDLGGESSSNYTVSGNVMEALEQFMTEERASIEAEQREKEERQRSWFAKKGAPQAEHGGGGSLPALDPAHRDLAGVSFDAGGPSHRSTPRPRQAGPSFEVGKKLFILGAVIAGLVLLYLGTDFALARIKEMKSKNTAEAFVYPNRALDMLAGGQPPAAALEEALTALRHNNTAENQAIAETVRTKLMEDVQARLNCVPYNRETVDAASTDISQAGLKDTDSRIIKMMDQVNTELSYYKFILVKIDPDAKTATFKLNNPMLTEKEQTVSEGEELQGRFIVKKIGPDFVRLEDPKVVSPAGVARSLTARIMNQISG